MDRSTTEISREAAAAAVGAGPAPPLSLFRAGLYGLGSMSNGIKNRSFAAFLLLFYNQVLGLPATTVGAVIMIVLMIDGLLDPTVGLISDNLRTRWGRRHPLMYASALPYGIAFALIWNPPAGLGPGGLVAWLTGCILAIRLFDTFFEVPASAMAPELTADYDRRSTLISFRYFFTFVGGMGLTFIGYRVYFAGGADGRKGLFDAAAYGHYGLLAGVVITAAILISTAGTHNRIPWLNLPPARRLTPRILVAEVLGTLANKSLWVATASGVFFAAAQGVASALGTYFNVYYWELTPAQLAYLVTAGLAGSFLGIVVGPMVTRRLGKKRGAMLLFAAAFVFSVAPIALRLIGVLPATGTPLVLGVLIGETFLSNAFALMLNIAVTSMIADLAEDSEVRTGRRSEGLIVSADNFLKKTTSGIGVFASSIMLGVAHFPDKAKPGAVPAEALRSLALMYLPTLGVLYVGAILCIIAYGIDRKRHEQNLEVLRIRAGDRS